MKNNEWASLDEVKVSFATYLALGYGAVEAIKQAMLDNDKEPKNLNYSFTLKKHIGVASLVEAIRSEFAATVPFVLTKLLKEKK